MLLQKATALMRGDLGAFRTAVELGTSAPRRIVVAVRLVFERGEVTLHVDSNTDEVLLTGGSFSPPYVEELPDDGFWTPAVGLGLSAAWDLQNLSGYWDGLQLAFGTSARPPVVELQVLAMASELDRRSIAVIRTG